MIVYTVFMPPHRSSSYQCITLTCLKHKNRAIEIDLENMENKFWMIEGPISLYLCTMLYLTFLVLQITLFTIEYVIQYQNDISQTLDYIKITTPI